MNVSWCVVLPPTRIMRGGGLLIAHARWTCPFANGQLGVVLHKKNWRLIGASIPYENLQTSRLRAVLFLAQKVTREKRMARSTRLMLLPAKSIGIDGVRPAQSCSERLASSISVSLPVCGLTKIGGKKEKGSTKLGILIPTVSKVIKKNNGRRKEISAGLLQILY